jgi:hypothetical protein
MSASFPTMYLSERDALLCAGFDHVRHRDLNDWSNDRSFYTRVEGWFRIRVVIPNTVEAKPALYIGLRLTRDGGQFVDSRSVFPVRRVYDAVDNGLGFLSVVRLV